MEGASITPGRLGIASVVLVVGGTVGIFNEGSARSMAMAAYLLMAGGVLGSMAFAWLWIVVSRRDRLSREEAAAAAATTTGGGAAQATDGQVAANPQDGGNSEPWQGMPQESPALPSAAAQPQWSPTQQSLHATRPAATGAG